MCAVAALCGGWHRMSPGQRRLLLWAFMSAVLGAAPMVLICAITAAVCVLTITIGFAILCFLLTRLLR
jgi:hypothetical protein